MDTVQLAQGEPAPKFSVTDHLGNQHNLEEYMAQGTSVILYLSEVQLDAGPVGTVKHLGGPAAAMRRQSAMIP